MNRVVGNIMKSRFGKISLLLSLMLLFAACGTSTSSPTPTPKIEIVGDLKTAAPASVVAVTSTATPTAFPSSTAPPTPRQVTVSRVDPNLDPRLITPMAEGADLPDMVMTDIDGNTIHLTDYKGRPLVLNFWSIGCGSCFYEFPLLVERVNYYGADQLAVVSINIAELPEETRLIAEQLGANFPVVVDHDAQMFTIFFKGAVVPTTIFITPDSKIAQVIIGPLDAYNLDLQLQALGLPPMEDE